MKLNTVVSEIERVGDIGREAQFDVNIENGVMYQLLSSMIYTDPVLAIIRELACNAFDAHVDAGKSDVPFDVHLPNELEPYFSIKDYGIGLSDDDIFDIYTTYGESSKTKSNKTIGALGLGSKSPFAIVSSYEVISRFNGKRIVYGMYKNEQNIPTVAQVNITDTDEVNGLEIKVPVDPNSKYYDDFIPKAKAALKYFPVRPNIGGNPNFELPDPLEDVTYQGNGWTFTEQPYSHKLTVLQQHVPYRALRDNIIDYLTPAARMLVTMGDITVTVPNGKLQFAASREEIRYEEDTINLIVVELEDMAEELYGMILESAHVYEHSNYMRIKHQLTMCENIFGSYRNGVVFISQFNDDADKTFFELANNYIGIEPGMINGVTDYHTMHQLDIKKARSRSGAVALQSVSKTTPDTISIRTNTLFVYDDTNKRGGISHLVNHLKYMPEANSQQYKRAVVISCNNMPNEQELEDISKMLGNPIIVPLSTIPRYVREKSTTKYVNNMVYRMAGYSRGYSNPLNWTGVSDFEDDGEDKLYFELNRKRLVVNGNITTSIYKSEIKAMINIINTTLDTEYTMSDVYGISCRHVNKVAKEDNWVDLHDLLEDCLIEHEEQLLKRSLAIRAKNVVDVNYINCMLNMDTFEGIVAALPDDSVFKSEVLPVMSVLNQHDTPSGVLNEVDISEIMGTAPSVTNFFSSISEQANDSQAWVGIDERKLHTTYPLLISIQHSSSDFIRLTHMLDYVLLVDNNS